MEPCNSVQYSQCLTEGVCVCVFDLINHLGRIVQDKVIEMNYKDRERERERESQGVSPSSNAAYSVYVVYLTWHQCDLFYYWDDFSLFLPLSHTHTHLISFYPEITLYHCVYTYVHY